MKKFTLIFIAIMLILAGNFSACKEKNDNSMKVSLVKGGSIEINENEFVTMSLIPLQEEQTNIVFKLIIENHTKGNLITSQHLLVECFDEESWIQIPLDIAFTDIGMIFHEGTTIEDKLCLPKKYFKKPERYRINKSFSLHYDHSSEIEHTFNLSAEFKLDFK